MRSLQPNSIRSPLSTYERGTRWGNVNPTIVVGLYQKYVDPGVTQASLESAGEYDRNNEWNVNRGAMHLRTAPNNLFAEVEIAAQATITRVDGGGQIVTDGHEICRDTGIGDDRRASDPTIVDQANALAREGRILTLSDPVGLYMDLDQAKLAGWATPDGSPILECWQVLRGNPGVRGRFEVPGNRFRIKDIKIGGDPFTYAGQLAEVIRIFLVAAYGPAHQVQPQQVPVTRDCRAPRATILALAKTTRFDLLVRRT